MSTQSKVAQDLQRIAQLDPEAREELAALVRQAGFIKPNILDVYYEPDNSRGSFDVQIKVSVMMYRGPEEIAQRLKEAEADLDSAADALFDDMKAHVSKQVSGPQGRATKRLAYRNLVGFEKDWLILSTHYDFGGFYSNGGANDAALHRVLKEVSLKHKARYIGDL